jgi:hypothetical protein
MISDNEGALHDLVYTKLNPEEEIRRLPKSRKVRRLDRDTNIKDQAEVQLQDNPRIRD